MGGCSRLLVGFPEKVQSWEPAIQGCRPAFGKASCSSALLPAMWPQGPTLSCKDALEKVSQPRQLQPISVMRLPRLLGTTENPEVKKTDQSESECLKGKPAPQQAAWNAVRTQPAAIPARLHGGIRQGGQPQPRGSWRAPPHPPTSPAAVGVGNPSVQPTCERPPLRQDFMCSSTQSGRRACSPGESWALRGLSLREAAPDTD